MRGGSQRLRRTQGNPLKCSFTDRLARDLSISALARQWEYGSGKSWRQCLGQSSSADRSSDYSL